MLRRTAHIGMFAVFLLIMTSAGRGPVLNPEVDRQWAIPEVRRVNEDTLSAKKNLVNREQIKAGMDSAKMHIEKAKVLVRAVARKEVLDSARSKMRHAWLSANKK